MFKKMKQRKKGKSPISLEDLVPQKDIRGRGRKQIFGILTRESDPKKTQTNNQEGKDV